VKINEPLNTDYNYTHPSPPQKIMKERKNMEEERRQEEKIEIKRTTQSTKWKRSHFNKVPVKPDVLACQALRPLHKSVLCF
jgi:hypothetical protein